MIFMIMTPDINIQTFLLTYRRTHGSGVTSNEPGEPQQHDRR